ncbi:MULTISPECIES: acyltransferase [Streptomyces]|uniref:Acyltransferase n=1 Tax=Streptomyces koelreuteriae TaxID=2838015 RepID=A0ABX8G2A2_9ACTN|nr:MULTISPECIES: acyltransferase [Streptomyces]QWB27653.1 acyltransferase [Streptomyces koelreuteriae]UUA10749.1 acyltransferase [Streptomyces koelreuteriae]UUA18356.1 acyltransferase [Streptomyces sp. CRCS-T-1]
MESPPLVPAAPTHLSRLGWLDALRGIAALVVVFDHSSYTFMPELRRELMPEFNTSRYGIMVFFLVSGYIIPASLERRGCVRTFWIGRIFRVYPLWAAVVAVLCALGLIGVAELRDFGGLGVVTVAVAHATMLQELLGTPNLLLVLWTLSYEMSFYLLVVALFTVRLHQRSSAVSVVLAGLAAVSVAAGVVLPVSALSGLVGTGPLVACASIAMMVAIGCASSGSPALRVFGGVLGGVLAFVLVLFNGTVPVWEGLVILAVMFLGTAVHRAEHGRSTWRATAVTALLVVVCAVGSAYRYGDGDHFTRRGWIVAFLLAVLTFGAGLWFRRRRAPRMLTVLGTISYSVYLVHPVLLAVIDGTMGRRRQDSLALEVAFFAVLLPLCLLTHRRVEMPGQTWGHRLTHRLRPRDERQRHPASHTGT